MFDGQGGTIEVATEVDTVSPPCDRVLRINLTQGTGDKFRQLVRRFDKVVIDLDDRRVMFEADAFVGALVAVCKHAYRRVD